jgi:site-specific recombinase
MRRFNPERARVRAEKLTQKLGGLASNVTLGLLLGGIPTLFALAELPLQIRHVTVSVSSVAMAMVTLHGEASAVAWAWAGVFGIGVTNVLVSFCLALWFALQATRGLERDASSAALVRLGIERWVGRKRFAPLPKSEFG